MAGLGYPEAICFPPTGSVFFADNFRIRSFTVGGIYRDGPAGVDRRTSFGDDGAADSGRS